MDILTSPKVAAVVPVHNGREETLAFLESLRRVTYPNLEIIVTDDGSTDGTGDAIEKHFPEVTVMKGDGNLWWSGGVNLGVAEALQRSVEFVLVINNDTVVEPGFLEPMLETACVNERSIVTSKIFDYEDRSYISSFGGTIDWFVGEVRDVTNRRDRYDFSRIRECPWVNGSSTLIPAVAFREVGLLDQQECPQYHGDTEFCLRARRKGFRILAEPRSIVYRKSHVSVGNRSLNVDRISKLLTEIQSPFYYVANRKIYREYCPYRPYRLFLAIRYARLLYSLFRRMFIDKTR